jgi:hypothetical protein
VVELNRERLTVIHSIYLAALPNICSRADPRLYYDPMEYSLHAVHIHRHWSDVIFFETGAKALPQSPGINSPKRLQKSKFKELLQSLLSWHQFTQMLHARDYAQAGFFLNVI